MHRSSAGYYHHYPYKHYNYTKNFTLPHSNKTNVTVPWLPPTHGSANTLQVTASLGGAAGLVLLMSLL
jgi:hypothetical protein